MSLSVVERHQTLGSDGTDRFAVSFCVLESQNGGSTLKLRNKLLQRNRKLFCSSSMLSEVFIWIRMLITGTM